MSILKLFSVLDTKVGAFMPPFSVVSKGQAIRSFEDACSDSSHQFHKHVRDFALYELGTFDDATGELVRLEHPVVALTGIEVANAQAVAA